MKVDPDMPPKYKAPIAELMRLYDAGESISVKAMAEKHDVTYITLNKYYKKAVDLRLGYKITNQAEDSMLPTTKATLDFVREDFAKFAKESLEQKKQAQDLLRDSIKLSSELIKSIPDFEELQNFLFIPAQAGDVDAKIMISLLSRILRALEASSFKNLKDLVATVTELDKSVASSMFLPYGTQDQLLRNKKLIKDIELAQEKINQLKKGEVDIADFFTSD